MSHVHSAKVKIDNIYYSPLIYVAHFTIKRRLADWSNMIPLWKSMLMTPDNLFLHILRDYIQDELFHHLFRDGGELTGL